MTTKIYTTITCPWCHRVKDYLKTNSIEFTEFDVNTNQLAAMEMVEKTGQMGVPVIDAGGTIIIGFDKNAIDKAFGI